MPTITMKGMWALLGTYTLNADGEERAVNHLNEWGGFSRRLGMPVFSGWDDLTTYDRETKMSKALVNDAMWDNKAGVNNQERWLSFAEGSESGLAAFFVIYAADEQAQPRKVESIGDSRVFVGTVVREGGRTFIVGQPRPL